TVWSLGVPHRASPTPRARLRVREDLDPGRRAPCRDATTAVPASQAGARPLLAVCSDVSTWWLKPPEPLKTCTCFCRDSLMVVSNAKEGKPGVSAYPGSMHPAGTGKTQRCQLLSLSRNRCN